MITQDYSPKTDQGREILRLLTEIPKTNPELVDLRGVMSSIRTHALERLTEEENAWEAQDSHTQTDGEVNQGEVADHNDRLGDLEIKVSNLIELCSEVRSNYLMQKIVRESLETWSHEETRDSFSALCQSRLEELGKGITSIEDAFTRNGVSTDLSSVIMREISDSVSALGDNQPITLPARHVDTHLLTKPIAQLVKTLQVMREEWDIPDSPFKQTPLKKYIDGLWSALYENMHLSFQKCLGTFNEDDDYRDFIAPETGDISPNTRDPDFKPLVERFNYLSYLLLKQMKTIGDESNGARRNHVIQNAINIGFSPKLEKDLSEELRLNNYDSALDDESEEDVEWPEEIDPTAYSFGCTT